MKQLNNVINIKTGQPIKSFRKRRSKVTVPELETKYEVDYVIKELCKVKHELQDVVIFAKRFDGSFWMGTEADPGTLGSAIANILMELQNNNNQED